MKLKKIIINVFILCLLNGCAQNAAYLGPAYTFTSTGNTFSTGLSYGSGKLIKEVTGKNSLENMKKIFAIKSNGNKNSAQKNFLID